MKFAIVDVRSGHHLITSKNRDILQNLLKTAFQFPKDIDFYRIIQIV